MLHRLNGHIVSIGKVSPEEPPQNGEFRVCRTSKAGSTDPTSHKPAGADVLSLLARNAPRPGGHPEDLSVTSNDRRRYVPACCCTVVLVVGVCAANSVEPDVYEDVLSQMSSDVVHEFASLRYLLIPAEIDDFAAVAGDTARRRWIGEFWRSRDPILTTPGNEMRIEHERRVAVADSLFVIPEWPGWDQRGEVYIRYGEPTFRHIIPSDIEHDSHSPIVPPRELWLYARHGMFVLFEDPQSNGDYSYYLERIEAEPGPRAARISQPIDAVFSGVAGRLPVVPDSEPIHQLDRFRQMVNHFQTVLESTPSSYPFSARKNRLPMFFDLGDFRGGDGVNRVEVHVQFVANIGEAHCSGSAKRYTATAVFWDIDRTEVGRVRRDIGLPVAQGFTDSLRLMPAQLEVSLPPGFYHMAVTVEEMDSGNFASYSARVNCSDYEASLAVSDILFAYKIVPARKLSPFNRGALEVVPHPIRRYRKTMKIPVYFELYNLDVDDSGHSRYTVEYRIVSSTPRKRGFWGWIRRKKTTIDVSSSFQASTQGTDDVVHITLGPEALWVGKYSLQVKIRDDISHKEASRESVFRIVE